jgi:hypothetical protein
MLSGARSTAESLKHCWNTSSIVCAPYSGIQDFRAVEYVWGYWKHHELPNVCPRDFLPSSAIRAAAPCLACARRLSIEPGTANNFCEHPFHFGPGH